METDINLDSCFKPSNDVVVREVMGKILIVPLTSGIGDLESDIFTLNESARSIWDRLVKGETVRAVIESLSAEYDNESGEIDRDVTGLLKELVQRRILEKITNV